MFELWKEELTEERTEELMDQFVEQVAKRGLNFPAMLFIESHKPLAYVGSQAAVALSPFLIPFFGFDKVNDYSRLISNRANIDRLVDKIVAASDTNQAKESA